MAEYIVSVEKQEDADEIERTYACKKLVRCWDCKHGQEYGNGTQCEFDGYTYSDDHFCSDGEPKEGD